MPRPQFSIRTLLWLTLVAAAFLGGMLFERERMHRQVLRDFGKITARSGVPIQ